MYVVRREEENPILSPKAESVWESVATYNPSAIRYGDGTRVFYRALGASDSIASPHMSLSTIGTAVSQDGTHFTEREQVIAPREDWDRFGCEDPRTTYFEGKWYCFYTALGGYPFGPDNIKVAVAIGDSPTSFTERHLLTPFNAKAATLFPERVGGDVVLLLTAHTDWTHDHPKPTIAIARAKEVKDFFDQGYWSRWHDELIQNSLAELRRADDDHIEVGATPLKTDLGWLLVYSYIQHYYDEHHRIFSVEAAILDHDDPRKLISRSYPFMVPEAVYEHYGMVPRIIFPTSLTVDGDTLSIWYGAADTVCAKANVRLSDFLRDLDPAGPARTFTRATENPILRPRGDGYESRSVFNAAAIDLDGSVHLLYRAMDGVNTSTLGYARSADGIHIDERLDVPAYVPRADFESKRGSPSGNSGCEDPRITHFGDRLHLTYTAYDGAHNPRGAASSISVEDFLAKRFDKWDQPVLVTPDEIDDKDVGLLPEQIDGHYIFYHRVDRRICADRLTDLTFNERVSRCIEVMGPREGMWDAAKVGIAGPPMKVDKGWLLIYHGVSPRARYRLGAALLDASGLTVIARTADPIFEAVEEYEKTGDVSNVVFSCGSVIRDDTLYLYYGGADKVVGVATASLSHILSALT